MLTARDLCYTALLIPVLSVAVSSVSAEDLLDVYRLATQSDPQLLAANATRRAALEAKPRARAQLLPIISFLVNGAYNFQKLGFSDSNFNQSDNFESYGYSINLVQPLYDHRLYVQLSQADASISEAEAQYGVAQQDLIVRLADAYFTVLSARDNLQFVKTDKEAIDRTLEQSRKRFEVGLIAITDVLESEAQYDLAVAREIKARNDLSDAREALSEITGQSHETFRVEVNPNMPLWIPAPPDIEWWTAVAQEKNLRLLSARYTSQVARKEISLERAGHYPTLSLVVQAARGINGGGLGGVSIGRRGFAIRGSTTDASIQLQVSVPIFSGFLVSSRTHQATYRYSEARENQEAARRTAVRQVRDAYRAVETSVQRVTALKQAVASTKSALEATTAGYQVGTRTIIEVLDAQSDYYQAIRNHKQARYTYLLSTLRLKQATGTLSEQDLTAINAWLQ
jgi:type I secretion outer membrane protein, TolC family